MFLQKAILMRHSRQQKCSKAGSFCLLWWSSRWHEPCNKVQKPNAGVLKIILFRWQMLDVSKAAQQPVNVYMMQGVQQLENLGPHVLCATIASYVFVADCSSLLSWLFHLSTFMTEQEKDFLTSRRYQINWSCQSSRLRGNWPLQSRSCGRWSKSYISCSWRLKKDQKEHRPKTAGL